MVQFKEVCTLTLFAILLSYVSCQDGTTKAPTTVLKQSNSPATSVGATTQKPTSASVLANPTRGTGKTEKPPDTKNNTFQTQKPDNPSVSANNTSVSTQEPNVISTTTQKPKSTSTLKPGNTPVPTQKQTTASTLKPSITPVPTQKPNSTSVPTLKPNSTSVPTQKQTTAPTLKLNSTSVSTKKQTTASVATQKLNSTSVPTQKQTTASTQKLNSTSVPTQKQTTASTQKLNSTSVPTQKQTTASTQKPNSTSVPTQKQTTASTQKLNSTSVPTQKQTTASTQKLNSTSVPTQKQTTASVSTQKPNSTSVSTQKQTPASTQKLNSTSVPTQKQTTASVSTQKPNSTSVSTQKPNNTSFTTTKPNSTSVSTQKPNFTSVSTQKSNITSSQKSSTTTVRPSRDEFVYINEIMLDKNGGFQKVELQLSKKFDITHYAMVMVDGRTNKNMSVVYLKDIVLRQNGLLVVTFNSSQTLPSMKGQGTGVAIYDMREMSLKDDWTVSEAGLVDALVIGKTYTSVSEHLTDILTPGVNPFVLDPNKYGMSKTISRCSSDQLRSTDMFALINPSFGADNRKKCRERLSASSDFAIKIIGINCSSLEDTKATKYDLTVKKLIHYIVKKVNTKCQCGVTWMHIISPTVHCCDGASLDMTFVAPNKEQLSQLKDNYRKFIEETQHVNVANHLYQINNSCYENCCGVPKHPKPQAVDDTAKNVKVTVAVIVSCLIVFMIVVLIVIMYMRRKKSAVYQFRMSRLDEDYDLVTDGPDHEDFVGGQEATFDINRR